MFEKQNSSSGFCWKIVSFIIAIIYQHSDQTALQGTSQLRSTMVKSDWREQTGAIFNHAIILDLRLRCKQFI